MLFSWVPPTRTLTHHCFVPHRPVIQLERHPQRQRVDPEGQVASQPRRSEEETGRAERFGSQLTRQHSGAERGGAAAGHSQEAAGPSRGCQVGFEPPQTHISLRRSTTVPAMQPSHCPAVP